MSGPTAFSKKASKKYLLTGDKMTIRFVLQPSALWPQPQPHSDPARERSNNIRFLEFWKRYGVFFMSPNNEPIIEALQEMPMATRKLWKNALISDYFRKFECGHEYTEDTFFNQPSLLSFSQDVDIACLENSTILQYCSDDEWSGFIEGDNLEVCRFDCIDTSKHLTNLKILWDGIIPIGTERDKIWTDRFLSLSSFAKHISIIDRYCGKSISECYSQGRLSGVTYFIKLLSQIPGKIKTKSVSIYTSRRDTEISEICKLIEKQLKVSKKNIGSVRLYALKDSDFSKVAHDRFLRFDNIITSIGKGISLFEKSSCEENFSCAMQSDDGSFRNNIEGVLQRCSQSYQIL
ncbi:hypothetical protein [Acetobacter senegalensis]|uniref:hypothetical protein n=1 Tax=Acetobacter senegalensis TaxID=446692 RepID=UPI0012E783C9|nr:hypothetical protein [Acetobacter senegalensis]